MVLHSSLAAAAAEAHRHDLLVDAERYRTARRVLKDSARSERRPGGGIARRTPPPIPGLYRWWRPTRRGRRLGAAQ
jgi:hypothetical protein